jgi:hypothetical protein
MESHVGWSEYSEPVAFETKAIGWDLQCGTGFIVEHISGAFRCTLCPANTYAEGNTCVPCSAGTELAGSSCVDCSPGRYKAAADNSRCSLCSPGNIQPSTGATACVMCAAGSAQVSAGATTCDSCSPGFHQPSNGSSNCLPCAAGSHMPLYGASTCSLCPSQQQQPTMGSISCKPCPPNTNSTPGEATCSMCAAGFYRITALIDASQFTCSSCVEHADCPYNATLETLQLHVQHWRLSGTSEIVSKCDQVSGGNDDAHAQSPCKGGRDARFEGSGYCQEGHAGPLCRICSEPKMYYNEGSCINCPAIEGRVMLVVGPIMGAILLLPPTTFAVARNAPRQYRWIVCWVNCLRMWLQDVAMMPKLKIAIGFFQTITFTPDVYGLALPGWYYDWTRFLNVFQSALQYFKPFPRQIADNTLPCVYS